MCIDRIRWKLLTLFCAFSAANSADTLGAEPFVEFAPFSNQMNSTRLSHGQLQISRMVSDRPQMRNLADSNSVLWTWAAKQFAGEFSGGLLYWQPIRAPYVPADYFSYCTPPTQKHGGSITVARYAQNKEIEGESLWAAAVFELLYLRRAPRLLELRNDIRAHKISKEQALKVLTEIEYTALSERARLYSRIIKAELAHRGIHANDKKWSIDTEHSYNEWINKFSSHDQEPWRTAETYYKKTVGSYE